MNTNPSPTQMVQSLYTAFGRSDIASVLAGLRDDVEWRAVVDPTSPGVDGIAMFAARRGPAAVGQFFADLRATLEIHSFEPRSFMANDREVAVHVKIEVTYHQTGRRRTIDAIHYWTFDEQGGKSPASSSFSTRSAKPPRSMRSKPAPARDPLPCNGRA